MEAIKSWLGKIGTKIESDIDGSITIQTVREPGGKKLSSNLGFLDFKWMSFVFSG